MQFRCKILARPQIGTMQELMAEAGLQEYKHGMDNYKQGTLAISVLRLCLAATTLFCFCLMAYMVIYGDLTRQSRLIVIFLLVSNVPLSVLALANKLPG
jgi:hypothetical protein